MRASIFPDRLEVDVLDVEGGTVTLAEGGRYSEHGEVVAHLSYADMIDLAGKLKRVAADRADLLAKKARELEAESSDLV